MRRLVVALLPLLLLAALPASAAADLGGLRVDGPPGAWRSSRVFNAEWDELATGPVGYRFLNSPWDAAVHSRTVFHRLEIVIPAPAGTATPPPGEYVVEMWVWSQGLDKPPGPSSYIGLRYDASTPDPPALAMPSGWIDARTRVPLSIDLPSAPPPSGIRGYALSVGTSPADGPCAIPHHCTDAEVDQPGGGRQLLSIGPLPEGTSYVNVVTVSGTGYSSAVSSVPVHVDGTPPAIRITGVPADWVNHPVAVGAVAEDGLSGMDVTGPSGPLTALAIDGELPTLALGGTAGATISGEGQHRIAAWGRDRLGNSVAPEQAPTATVRIDETPPRVAFASVQRPNDPELIEVQVADGLSGPSPDRGVIGFRPAGTNQRFQPLPTRATVGGLAARWSSDDFSHGDYEFRATGFDAAGNSTVAERRADGSPMVLRNPVKVPTAITSGFGGARLVWHRCHRVDGGRRCKREAVRGFDSRPALWTVPYGRSLGFAGILRTTAGAPIGGQRIEIVETFAPGADSAERRTTVLSGADGRFDARLAPGPSRRVEAFFPGTGTLARGSGRSVTMAVRAGLRLRASTRAAPIGGDPVIFSGRLLAGEADIPRTGRPVQLQFRVPGGAWSEFRTVQTDRHGRFRYPYAFTDDDSRGIRFQFRAISPEQSDWPYRPATSPPVAVTGY
jgi:hypothetical protein